MPTSATRAPLKGAAWVESLRPNLMLHMRLKQPCFAWAKSSHYPRMLTRLSLDDTTSTDYLKSSDQSWQIRNANTPPSSSKLMILKLLETSNPTLPPPSIWDPILACLSCPWVWEVGRTEITVGPSRLSKAVNNYSKFRYMRFSYDGSCQQNLNVHLCNFFWSCENLLTQFLNVDDNIQVVSNDFKNETLYFGSLLNLLGLILA